MPNVRFAVLFGTSILTATPALANITPRDAVAVLEAQITAMGFQPEIEVSEDGDAVVIEMVTASFTLPDYPFSASVELGSIRLSPDNNGGVRLTPSANLPLNMSAAFPYGSGGFGGVLTSTFYSGIMTGTPDDVTTNWSIDGLTFIAEEVINDGELIDPDLFNVVFTYDTPVTYQIHTRISDSHVTVMSVTEPADATMQIQYSQGDTDTATQVASVITLLGVSSRGSMVLPAGGLDPLNLPAQLRDGLRIDLATSIDQQYQREITTFGDGEIEQESTYRDQKHSMRIDENGIAGTAFVGPSNGRMHSPGMSLDIAFAVASTVADMAVPLLTGDAPQPAEMNMTLTDLTLGDETWAMFDPGRVLPRDPAQIDLAATGTMRPAVDLLDFLALANLGNDLPMLVDQVALKNLRVSAAGAELTGVGNLAFDYDAAPGPGAMPMPDGTLDLRITGANGLIDNLVMLGLLTDDDAMGARMIMGMFGRAGETEDEVLSTLEFNAAGEIHANGQRIQ